MIDVVRAFLGAEASASDCTTFAIVLVVLFVLVLVETFRGIFRVRY